MYYSKDHVWVRPNKDAIIVGLTDYAQKELGEMSFVELPDVGMHVEADQEVCSIDSLKSTSDIYAPVSGEITEVNGKLAEKKNVTLINTDPYGEGWIFAMRAERNSDVLELMDEKAYNDYTSG